MTAASPYQSWQLAWGTPRGVFVAEWPRMQAMLVIAFLIHSGIFGYLWKHQIQKKAQSLIELQNVDLLEPETEEPPAPPPVEVQKPKNALEFLKMAIPIFKKPAAPEIREVAPAIPKTEPKIAEPERLIEKKMQAASQAPEIKLDKNAAASKVIEIAKIPKSQRPEIAIAKDPSIKLEEVGRRAVPVPQTPAISLDRGSAREKMADVPSISRQALAPRTPAGGDRLVERAAPSSYSKPPSEPLGYAPRGGVSLDGPRDVARSPSRPAIETHVAKPKEDKSPLITISKEKVKITGPLQFRKVLKSFVPEYPAWARAQNLEADTAIRFTVAPSGEVSGNPVVERTSGYPELDRLCLQALKSWRFSPISGSGQDQWGVITFRFRLD